MITKKQTRVLEILKTLAMSSDGVNSSKHAAAIVQKGEIISFGINQMKSHPFQKQYSKNEHAIYFHAEVHSIYNALKKLSVEEIAKCDLYVVRVLKDGSLADSCPCEGCMMAIAAFDLRAVYFSDAKQGLKKL